MRLSVFSSITQFQKFTKIQGKPVIYSGMFLLVCLISGFVSPPPKAMAADINQLRFKQSMWDDRVLRILIEGPAYLKAEREFEISPPPKNDSEITKQELETLRLYQRPVHRTKSQIAKIRREAGAGAFVDMFIKDEAIPPALGEKAHHLLSMGDDECQYFVVKYKKRFSRPRPNQLEKSLNLVVPNPGHAAYPSGHATQSMLMALILSELDPAHQEQYHAYAKAMAKRREIAGVHYPTDSSAGQKLAVQIFTALKTIEEFSKEMALVKQQLKQLAHQKNE